MRPPRNQTIRSRRRAARAKPPGALPSGCTITPTGLTLPPRLTFARWQAIGHALAQRRTQLKWAFGDWWRSGHAYGERKAMTEAPDWTGPSFSTCMNIGSVAEAFAETSRRREVLSFQHHVEVAKLEPAEADALLQWCIDTGAPGRPRTIADLRAEIARRDPKTKRVLVKILPPLAQTLSAGGQYTVRRLLALESGHASQTTQPEQASAARPLALPAPEQPQCEPPSNADTLSETPQPELPSPATALAVLAQERCQWEPDARWTTIISALEHALTIAQTPEDRERFQDALNAAQEVRANYLWR